MASGLCSALDPHPGGLGHRSGPFCGHELRTPVLARYGSFWSCGPAPRYDLIHQTSLDVQFTTGSWLWKLESITRDGHGAHFAALVVGFEYTFFGVFGSAADLGVLAAYLYDGRGDDAPGTSLDDDVFVGVRLALNDPQSTDVLAGAVVDRNTQATFVNLEASRRFGERWTIELEARVFINIPRADVLFGLHWDDYVQIRVARYF